LHLARRREESGLVPGAPLVRNAAIRSFGWMLAAVLLVGLLSVSVPAAAARTVERPSGRTAVLEAELLVRVNALRHGRGLAPLSPSYGLRQAAAAHSRTMATRGFFRHDSLGGGRFWQRIRPYYPRRGAAVWSVGENLLWATPHVDAAQALTMWLASPTHRRTLLRPRWREIGLAAVHVRSAPGFFGGRRVTIVTADFGVRG
jgi:uncharacterized protein YkwD